MILTKILITRYGGAGDMLMMEPAIEALYYKYRPCEIHLRTHPHYVDLMPFHPLISKVIPGILTASESSAPGLPSDEKKPQGYDLFFNTTGCVEMNRGIHGIDSFAHSVGTPVLRRTPVLYLDPAVPVEPLDIVVHTPKRSDRSPRNADFRTYDIPMLLDAYLRAEGVPFKSITAIGAGEEQENGLQSFARTIAGAKLFIGPDSAGAHIAAALSVPSVVAYTRDFPAAIRTYHNVTIADDGDTESLLKTAVTVYANPPCRVPPPDMRQQALPTDMTKMAAPKFMGLLDREDWRGIVRKFHENLEIGGTMFLYEQHPRFSGKIDPLLLVKFLIEDVGFEIINYSATADSYGYFCVFARKHRRGQAMIRIE
jgi:hypothetical protein